ncbi:MAG: hypothetical protein M3Q69_17745 [Acidobacteriota bacterium]|nr:hypothetical protein [Acidobacteriota bacterium]
MPKVTVRFSGICTFLTSGHPELKGYIRAVLVDASNGAWVAGHAIPPHIAAVQIGGNVPIRPAGLSMRLIAPAAEPARIDAFTSYAPNLTELIAQHHGTLSPPSSSVAFGDGAALHFDFRAGTLTACRDANDAICTTLTVEAPEIALETTSLTDQPLPAGLPPRIDFSEDTHICVRNEDVVKQAFDADFLLHYATAAEIPANPPIVTSDILLVVPRCETPPQSLGSIGAGCSNSNYP